MVDPLAEMVTLLQPSTPFAKRVLGASPWYISRSNAREPFYCVVLEGGCRVMVDGLAPIELLSGDFALIPSTRGFAMSSIDAPPSDIETAGPTQIDAGVFRIGAEHRPVDVQMFIGHCRFGSPDASLLLSLLPQVMQVRGEPRLTTLVQLMRDESREQRAAREVVLAKLLELLFIEALRLASGAHAAPGLARGLADPRLAIAIRAVHEHPAHPWTIAEFAKATALSRTTFFERFSRTVGITPMEYLLAWRMALAKDLLRRNEGRVAEIATRVGYGSASTFSVAFTRHVGQPPSQFAREAQANEPVVEDSHD